MDNADKLAALTKKMHLSDLRATLQSLWTVCHDGSTDPLDYLISGVGNKGTVVGRPGVTGTEVRIHFGGKDTSRR